MSITVTNAKRAGVTYVPRLVRRMCIPGASQVPIVLFSSLAFESMFI